MTTFVKGGTKEENFNVICGDGNVPEMGQIDGLKNSNPPLLQHGSIV